MTRAIATLILFAAAAGAAPSPADVALYQHWCARCHGERGDGRGPAAVALGFNGAPPRDFTTGRFKLTSVASGSAPSREDLARAIRSGIPGTSMPYFSDLLSADAIARLVAVVQSFATTPRAPGTPLDLGREPPDDDDSRRRGAVAYVELGCPACHGDRGRGDGASAAQLRASDGTRIAAADLTRPWTFKGGATAADVTMRLASGIGGTPMPSYLDAASTAQLWDVSHWVLSRARAPSLAAAAREAARGEAGAGEPPAKRGEYLAQSGTCFLCHVQMQPDGAYVPGSFGAGGMRVVVTHSGVVYTRNLTPDPDTGLGGWSNNDLRAAIRRGRSRNGRVLNALDMPWTILAGVRDADVDAIHAYLQSLPPVRNRVPPPAAPSLVDGTVGKLRAFLTGEQIAGIYHPGNAGRTPPPDQPIALVVNPSTDTMMMLGCLFALALYATMRKGQRRLEKIFVWTVLIVVPLVYTWPPLRWMPPALVKAAPPVAALGRALGLPPLRPPPFPVGNLDDDTRALVNHGRYVATVGTCSLCHTAGPDPLRLWQSFPDMGGGMRVAWKVFGTTYSRNLTPDRETGLGAWNDAQIRRAITSGISRDGRIMHWQAMPWDHFSRLTPEDLEALIAYLRHIPPARSEVPLPVAPAPDDPDGDAFGFGYSGTYRR